MGGLRLNRVFRVVGAVQGGIPNCVRYAEGHKPGKYSHYLKTYPRLEVLIAFLPVLLNAQTLEEMA